MELLLLLLLAHFIGDFYFQPSTWIECRNKHHFKSQALWKHFLVHISLNTVVFLISDLSLLQSVLAIGLISISHLLIDYWKSYRKKNLTYFLIDQISHIVVICVVWAYFSGITLEQVAIYVGDFVTVKNMLIAVSYILVCKPASVIISLALKKHTDSILKENRDMGLASAGAWIGYIERCLTISFIFIGQFAGIGFLVATKTIFRFGDLTRNKDMKLTEYMMLGTLLSYAIALIIGLNVLQIYKTI